MITIELLKNHSDKIPQLAHILYNELCKKWFPEYSLKDIESWFYEWLNDHMPLAYIALSGETPVGCCSLQLHDGVRPDLSPWLGDLVVDRRYKKQGVGKTLINAVKAKTKEFGFNKLYLFTVDPTIPEYYERLGWKQIGIDEFKSHPVTVMEVEL